MLVNKQDKNFGGDHRSRIQRLDLLNLVVFIVLDFCWCPLLCPQMILLVVVIGIQSYFLGSVFHCSKPAISFSPSASFKRRCCSAN